MSCISLWKLLIRNSSLILLLMKKFLIAAANSKIYYFSMPTNKKIPSSLKILPSSMNLQLAYMTLVQGIEKDLKDQEEVQLMVHS